MPQPASPRAAQTHPPFSGLHPRCWRGVFRREPVCPPAWRSRPPGAPNGSSGRSASRTAITASSPAPAIIAQGICSSLICLTGKYRDLYEFVIFPELFFFCLVGAAVFVLRKKYPTMERPYRVWGYPLTPLIFIAVNGWIFVNMLIKKPRASLIGLAIVLAGLPAYFFWKRRETKSLQ